MRLPTDVCGGAPALRADTADADAGEPALRPLQPEGRRRRGGRRRGIRVHAGADPAGARHGAYKAQTKSNAKTSASCMKASPEAGEQLAWVGCEEPESNILRL